VVEEGGGHLAAAGVVDTDEQDLGHVLDDGSFTQDLEVVADQRLADASSSARWATHSCSAASSSTTGST
jgi:hypothetical protein